MKIRIEKIKENPGGLPSHSKEDYVYGADNGREKSIPIDYWVEGELIIPEIKVGSQIFIAREIRNGVKVDGVFSSSRVVEFDDKIIKTKNSIYNYKFLE